MERWVVLDNLDPQVHPGAQPPTDLPDSVDLRPDMVIHLAAETGTAQSLSESTRHGMVNAVGRPSCSTPSPGPVTSPVTSS